MDYHKPLMSKTQTICLILLWILFILFAFISIQEILKNKKEKKDLEYQEVSLKDPKVVTSLATWQLNYGQNVDSLVDKLYQDHFYLKELNQEEKLSFILRNELLSNEDKVTLTIDDLNNLGSNYFEEFNLNKEELLALITKDKLGSIYNLRFSDNTLEVINNRKEEAKKILFNLEEALENKEYLKIKFKLALKEEKKENGETIYFYYQDLNQNIKEEKLYQVDEDKIKWDNYHTYEFTFLKKDNNYYLKEVNLLT